MNHFHILHEAFKVFLQYLIKEKARQWCPFIKGHSNPGCHTVPPEPGPFVCLCTARESVQLQITSKSHKNLQLSKNILEMYQKCVIKSNDAFEVAEQLTDQQSLNIGSRTRKVQRTLKAIFMALTDGATSVASYISNFLFQMRNFSQTLRENTPRLINFSISNTMQTFYLPFLNQVL